MSYLWSHRPLSIYNGDTHHTCVARNATCIPGAAHVYLRTSCAVSPLYFLLPSRLYPAKASVFDVILITLIIYPLSSFLGMGGMCGCTLGGASGPGNKGATGTFSVILIACTFAVSSPRLVTDCCIICQKPYVLASCLYCIQSIPPVISPELFVSLFL